MTKRTATALSKRIISLIGSETTVRLVALGYFHAGAIDARNTRILVIVQGAKQADMFFANRVTPEVWREIQQSLHTEK